MTRVIVFLFSVLLISSFFSFGQRTTQNQMNYDSVRVVRFNIHKIDTSVFIENTESTIDTTSRYFHIYNPSNQIYLYSSNLGNIGSATQNMIFKPVGTSGFNYGNSSFRPYIYLDEDKNFYYSLKPYTDLYFSSGMKKEQNFYVTHLHNVRNKLFMGANYRIINAPGRDYFRQKTIDHTLSTFLYYQTKNKRYGVFGNYLFSNIKNQENGGVTDDTVYLNYRSGKSSVAPKYYLESADNLVKESSIHIKQYYSMMKRDSVVVNDTSKRLRTFMPGRIIHSFDFVHQKSRFTNGLNNGYFPLVPFDTANVADSCVYYQIRNSLEWTNSESRRNGKPSVFRYSAKLSHTYTEIHQLADNYHFINLIPSVWLSLKPVEHVSVDVWGEYVLLNRFKDDFSVQGMASYSVVKKGKSYGRIAVEADYRKKEPGWFFQHYHSAYFNWDNNFAKEEVMHAGLNYSYRSLKAGVDYYNVYNYVYMDASARPNQYLNGTVDVFSAYVFKKFLFWKFEIDNKVVYQYTDKPGLLRRPQLIASQSYVFSTHLFKRALFFLLGIDLTYNTKYLGDAYQPATRSFHLQNTREVGNYLYADAFLNLKIKRFKVFLQLTNFLSGAIGYNNFTVPHYPGQDRVFKFGVGWLFHD